jgi:hypothetical protein
MGLTNVYDGSSVPVIGFYFLIIDHDFPPLILDG